MKVAEDRLTLFAEYALDRARGCLLCGESPVHLRPQAYQLLSYLVERPGVLILKDEIIERIWEGRAVTDDSLVQCLRDVRQALGEGGSRYIRTVRGRGYIFDPLPDPPPLAVQSVQIEAAAPLSLRHRSGWTIAIGVVLAAFLAAAAGGAYRGLDIPPAVSPDIESLAVLPFVNETGDNETEYLADGCTDALINTLTQDAHVSVKARSTVFRFKGKKMTPQAIAKDLGVQAVVDPRLRRIGDSLVASVALVDARTGNQLWGQQYNHRLADLQSMQREIAADLSKRLQVKRESGQIGALKPGYTTNSDAYLLYLRGRYHFLKTTESEIQTALALFQKAAELDPHSALPYRGLAEANRALSIVGQMPSNVAFPRARVAAMRALDLDSTLAEAHISLGWIGFSYDWDWATAEQELQAAIALSPGNAEAHRAYAHMLSNQGRHEEALFEAARARELDPRNPLSNALEGQFLFYAGRLDDAENRLRKTLEIEPDYWVPYQGLGRVYVLRGMYPEAIAAFRKARQLSDSATEPMTQLGYALARSGDRKGALAIFNELQVRAKEHYVPAYSFAMISNGLGDRDAALRALERSGTEREVQLTFIKIDTRWDSLRPDPRFIALLKLVNLAQ